MSLLTRRRSQTVLTIVLVLAVILTASGLFNIRKQRLQYRRYPQIGRSVNIGGRSLNIFCSGEGSPTVIFETVSHQAGFTWSAVQPNVARFTRACWYDRAGYGWSDEGPSPRTFKAASQDLHALLSAAQLRAPYLFVGQGDAVSEIRIYNGLYKTDVAGVVFIDGNNLDLYAHHLDVPDSVKGPWQKSFGSLAPYGLTFTCHVLSVARPLSFLMPKFGNPRPTTSYGMPAAQRAELDFLSDRAFGDACYVGQNEAELLAAGDLKERPLIVLASKQQVHAGGKAKALRDWNEWWVRQEQPSLAALSTKGQLRVMGNGVDVESIVAAVSDIIHDVRNGPAEATF